MSNNNSYVVFRLNNRGRWYPLTIIPYWLLRLTNNDPIYLHKDRFFNVPTPNICDVIHIKNNFLPDENWFKVIASDAFVVKLEIMSNLEILKAMENE